MEQMTCEDDHVNLVRLWALQAAKAQAKIDDLVTRKKKLDELCRWQSAGLMSMVRQRHDIEKAMKAEEEKRDSADAQMLEFIKDAIRYGQV